MNIPSPNMGECIKWSRTLEFSSLSLGGIGRGVIADGKRGVLVWPSC